MTYSNIVIRYNNVKTDTGKTYDRIDYNQFRVDADNPQNEGISIFSIAIPADNEKGFVEVNVGEPAN